MDILACSSNMDPVESSDGPTPKLSPLPSMPSSPSLQPDQENMGTHICYVCRRRLGSADMLKKHEELSALHQKNLRIAKQTAQRRRQEIRNDVVRLRYMMQGGGLAAASPSASKELRRLESELGHAQQDMETSTSSLESEMEIGNYAITVKGVTWTGNKSSNEDRMALCIDLGRGLKGCLIADGHCGDHCADYLVEHLGENIRKILQEHPEKTVQEGLKEGFLISDKQYLEFAKANEIPSGSTAIMIAFSVNDEGILSCVAAHVGDSRAIASVDSQVTRMTTDHKPDRPDEKIRLSESGGHVVDVGGVWRVFTPNIVSIGGRSLQWGLAVSRAFGDLALKHPTEIVTAEPEISDSVSLSDGSCVVIACDGIFDVLNDEETVEAAQDGGPAAVLRTAYGKLSDDNLTAIVCTVKKKESEAELQRRPSVMSEPTGKKQRFEPPEMVPPSQQI